MRFIFTVSLLAASLSTHAQQSAQIVVPDCRIGNGHVQEACIVAYRMGHTNGVNLGRQLQRSERSMLLSANSEINLYNPSDSCPKNAEIEVPVVTEGWFTNSTKMEKRPHYNCPVVNTLSANSTYVLTNNVIAIRATNESLVQVFKEIVYTDSDGPKIGYIFDPRGTP